MNYDSLIVFSNLIYLIPIFVILYEKFLGNKNNKFKSYYSNPDCLILICSFILITFISSIYHNCIIIYEKQPGLVCSSKLKECRYNLEKGDLNFKEYRNCNRDVLQIYNDIPRNNYCPFYNNWSQYKCYNNIISLPLLKLLDHLVAYTLICIIFIIITPFYGNYKFFMLYLLFVFNIIILCIDAVNFEKLYGFSASYIIYIIIGLLAIIYFANFIYYIKQYSYISIILLIVSILFFIAAIICFILPNKIYNNHENITLETEQKLKLYHSLWHIFSGISGSLLLLIRVKYIN